jgi:hypothetical protein
MEAKRLGLIGMALGMICFIFGLVVNSTGTGTLSMIQSTAVSTQRQYLGTWLSRTDVSPDSNSVDEDPSPFYCAQNEDSDHNNCPIGRVHHATDCCNAWQHKCSTWKTYGCLGKSPPSPSAAVPGISESARTRLLTFEGTVLDSYVTFRMHFVVPVAVRWTAIRIGYADWAELARAKLGWLCRYVPAFEFSTLLRVR